MTEPHDNFSAGVGAFRHGLKQVFAPGLRRYTVLPVLINALLFGLGIGWTATEFDAAIDRLLPDYLDWLAWLLWPLFAVVVLVIVVYTFTLLANLVGAPFNQFLAEAVMRRDAGLHPEPVRIGALLRSVPGAIFNELRKWLYFGMLAVLVLIISFIPGLQILAVILWPLLSCWMLSLEYSDYPMSADGQDFFQQRIWWRRHRSLAVGFGGSVALCSMIPIVNLIVMPAAVIGATELWLKHRRF